MGSAFRLLVDHAAAFSSSPVRAFADKALRCAMADETR
jgi:hypothetical protein